MTRDPSEILRSFADRIVGVVLDGLTGEGVESIFLSGSAARGDVAAFRGPDGVEIYSDLDLYVVLRRPRNLDEARRRARREAAAVPRAGDGYRIFPEPDVGVFSEEDFLSQQVRPGTVEIAGSHVTLVGNDTTPAQAGRFEASAVDVSEGLYLLENRLTELADLSDHFEEDHSGGFRRYFSYALAKSCLDAVSATLIAEGRFHPSRDERMRRFRDAGFRAESARFLPEGSLACIERCHAALADLQTTLADGLGVAPDLKSEVELVLLRAWEGVARRAGARVAGDWNASIDWRCKRGRWIGNSRELRALAGRMGISRLGALWRCGSLARLSPVEALRLSGTVETLLQRAGDEPIRGTIDVGAVDKGYVAVLDGLTRAFGYSVGPVFRRGRRLFRETA